MVKDLMALSSGFAFSRMLMAANNLGVFERLAHGSSDADSLAAALGLNKEGALLLCNALVSLGILKKDQNKYYLNPDIVHLFLNKPQFVLHNWIKFQESLWKFWENLEETVKHGQERSFSLFFDKVLPNDTNRNYFAYAMHEKSISGARAIAKKLPLLQCRRVMDLGGGIGTYALEWCKMFPDMTGVIYDLPEIICLADQFIESYLLKGRLIACSGDFLRDPLPGGFDLIVLANVLHMYDEGTSRQIIVRTYNTLQKNGRIVIHGYIPDKTGTMPVEATLFAFIAPYLTTKGCSHNNKTIEKWLKDTGFIKVKTIKINARPSIVVTAVKE